jgi:hypothetical protein
MFRFLSNGLAAVGLAALVAVVAFAGGAVTRTAEAAPTAVSVNIVSASISCNGSSSVTATVTDSLGPQTGTPVTFSASSGGTISNASTVAGVASTTLYATASYSGTITVTATAGGVSGSDTVSVTCGTGSPCYGGSCYNNCGQYANCGYNTCGYYNNYTGCGYGSCYNAYYLYSNCGYGSNCGYNSGTACGCGGYGYGCGTNCGYGYGCGGNYCATGTFDYNSCNFPSCGNLYGPILNCSNSYVPAGNLQYLPGHVSILPSSPTATCGSATAITVIVSDPNGFRVPDGTVVNFTTSLGYISSTDSTIGGTAVTSLTIPPGTSGAAKVTASSGGHAADTTINVTCAQGAPAVASIPAYTGGVPAQLGQLAQSIPQLQGILPAITSALTGRPPILPPSTGDAGLLELESE